MKTNKWYKMSEQQPQIDGWSVQHYVGIDKFGYLVLFVGMADENIDGEVIEHWSYLYDDYDCIDFEDIVWWMKLPERPDTLSFCFKNN